MAPHGRGGPGGVAAAGTDGTVSERGGFGCPQTAGVMLLRAAVVTPLWAQLVVTAGALPPVPLWCPLLGAIVWVYVHFFYPWPVCKHRWV